MSKIRIQMELILLKLKIVLFSIFQLKWKRIFGIF